MITSLPGVDGAQHVRAAGRGPNGYREYTDADVDRATLVSSLVRSGLPTRLIIPLLGGAERDGDDLADLFAAESARLTQRIDCMTLSRDAIEEHLQVMASRSAGGRPPAPAGP